MGGLAIESFLAFNPDIASKLAGVVYCAPMFGTIKKINIF
jgi:hypothetical protein